MCVCCFFTSYLSVFFYLALRNIIKYLTSTSEKILIRKDIRESKILISVFDIQVSKVLRYLGIQVLRYPGTKVSRLDMCRSIIS